MNYTNECICEKDQVPFISAIGFLETSFTVLHNGGIVLFNDVICMRKGMNSYKRKTNSIHKGS